MARAISLTGGGGVGREYIGRDSGLLLPSYLRPFPPFQLHPRHREKKEGEGANGAIDVDLDSWGGGGGVGPQ